METGLYVLLAVLATPPQQATPVPQGQQLALICFNTGEESSGLNKICYYDCGGSRAAITVRSTSLCPLSINR